VHVTVVKPVQMPVWHVSVCVQALPSLHDVPFGAFRFEQVPVAGSHVPATWHWSLAVHVTVVEPVQMPDWHVSVCVQALPSLHGVPFDLKPSAGQPASVPVQVSAASHSPAAARHTVPAETNLSDGQLLLVPSHVSATSQPPAAGRHTVPPGLFASAGQVVLIPLQVSAGSQAPVDARHTAPAFPAGC
jgi:hypothetical protein